MKRYQCVLITGASSGIGRELAYRLAPHAASMVLVARSTEKMLPLATDLTARFNTQAVSMSYDLSVEGNAENLWDAVIRKMGKTPDLVINDAGVGFSGDASAIPLEKEKAMVALNVTSLLVLSKLALKVMSARRKGVLVNVASLGGFFPGPYMAAYYATKSFVLSYTEAVAEEARHYGVRVIALCPGYTTTPFHALAGARRGGLLAGYFRTTPAMVAEATVRSILSGYPDVVIPGWKNRFLAVGSRFMPRCVLAWAAGRFLKG